MKFPDIGGTVTPEYGLDLCRHFGLLHLVERLEAHPERYKSFVFDGCSCLPDELIGLIMGCDWKDITYKCCLPHDLRYAYGEPGNYEEKAKTDDDFRADLISNAGMAEWMAAAFHAAVVVGGAEALGLSFSWAFARREKP